MRWVIGDVHGMLEPLSRLLDAIGQADTSPWHYFVGDYVNRGPESKRVIDLLLGLKDARFCRGNHDDVFDLILHEKWLGGEDGSFDPLAAFNWFLDHGLIETLTSYGVSRDAIESHRRNPDDRRSSGNKLLKLVRDAVPAEHKKFIRQLKLVIDEPDVLVAHAFWPPEEPNDSGHLRTRLNDVSMRHRMLWERYRIAQIHAEKPWTRPAFFGHTPVTNYPPSVRNNAIVPVTGPMITLLDTASAVRADGLLSAVCVEDGRLILVDRSNDVTNSQV